MTLKVINFGKRPYMKRSVILIILIILIAPFKKVNAYTEVGGSFGYDREIYGSQRENKLTTRSYGGTLAIYFLQATALEFNYTESVRQTKEHTTYSIEDVANVSVIGNNSNMETKIYGIGLRQAFADRGARFRPMISLGYAKQFVESSGDTYYRLESTKQVIRVYQTKTKTRIDSVFGAFQLGIAIYGGLSLNTSIRTYIKAFEFNRAQDNLKFMVGLSWMF